MLHLEFSSFVRRDLWDSWLIINNINKSLWGEARFPPYTNESLVIRYPPMLFAAPQLPLLGKNSYRFMME
jgi:hypothetical protein